MFTPESYKNSSHPQMSVFILPSNQTQAMLENKRADQIPFHGPSQSSTCKRVDQRTTFKLAV